MHKTSCLISVPVMCHVIHVLSVAYQAIQKGNMEQAKIYAENAIRQKNQAVSYRRMSARVDAVAARVQTAVTTKQITKSMSGVVRAMESTMRSMDLAKVGSLKF